MIWSWKKKSVVCYNAKAFDCKSLLVLKKAEILDYTQILIDNINSLVWKYQSFDGLFWTYWGLGNIRWSNCEKIWLFLCSKEFDDV
jgi:hypothetical protein